MAVNFRNTISDYQKLSIIPTEMWSIYIRLIIIIIDIFYVMLYSILFYFIEYNRICYVVFYFIF